jgi:hypothetical protein
VVKFRYIVLRKRPEATATYGEDLLASLVTRDAMIGVIPVTIIEGRIT